MKISKGFSKISIEIESQAEATILWNCLNSRLLDLERNWIGKEEYRCLFTKHLMFENFDTVFDPKG